MIFTDKGVQRPHPLEESIGRAAVLYDRFTMPIRDLAFDQHQDQWIGAESFFQHDDQRLQDSVITLGQTRWGTDNRHLAGSGFIVAYLTRLTYPLISQYVLERRVLDVSLRNLAFHTDGNRINGTSLIHPRFAALADDSASAHPDAQVVLDDNALYERLKERLFENNFELVIPSLHRAARASFKVSWNAVASSCAQVFHRLYNLVDDPDIVVQKAEAFFGDPSSPVYRQINMSMIEHRGNRGYFARRAGCCLWWRAREPKEYCSGCVLLSREEQDSRFREILESQM